MQDYSTKIAVIGVAGRFPGADSASGLWTKVVRSGIEAVTRFEQEGGSTTAFGVLENPALFDNEFFDMSPAEARTITPEHRVFLECVWAALENAGIDITSYDGYVSVYGSASNHSASYLRRLVETVAKEELAGSFDVLIGNAMDSLATRVGYKLGLRGECISIQTHCSSSLTATHLACQSLLSGQSDIAIAGGVSVRGSVAVDQEAEMAMSVAQEGFILSRDGRCLALLDGATGTLPGDGAGVVVLKMLEDALRDGDYVYAVISGSAINNDGRRKVGFTAPSVEGVTDAISDALAFAGLDPEQIGYLECHGTGTDLGDAIELRSLRRVFEIDGRDASNPLYVGSIKSNIGHLAAAAGVSSLIKAVMAVHQAEIPALTHADSHQPHSEVRDSPVLEVPTTVLPWESDGLRRAGVSSLGIGGTNVHVIVEQAPSREAIERSRPASVLVWSARTPAALEKMTRNLQFALQSFEPDVQDVATTLQRGRAKFRHRRCLVATDAAQAASKLDAGRFLGVAEAFHDSPGKTAFMFPGSGAYRAEMVRQLLADEPRVREHVQTCHDILQRRRDFDLLGLLESPSESAPSLQHLQTAVVSVEYALAQFLIETGCQPDVLIGSSLGEYAAACVSGALSVEDMLHLVYRRGELMERVTGGSMMLVSASLQQIQEATSLGDEVEVAIRVAPEATILSGPREAVQRVAAQLEEAGLNVRGLPPTIAYHSAALDPIEDDFVAAFKGVEFRTPSIPYVSNRTGDIITPQQLTSPAYWFEQLRHTVDLETGFQTLYDQGVRLFLEVGPGHGMTKFAQLNLGSAPDVVRQPCLAHPKSDQSDWTALAEAIGTAWMAGHAIDWRAFGDEGRSVPLPAYPFQGRYFYLGEPIGELPEGQESATTARRAESKTMPRNFLEEKVAAIWTDILGVEDIGIDENFFDLGGDSLQATRVLGALQSQITSEITIEDLMNHRTVRDIARTLERALAQEEESSEEAEYYCSFELDFGGAMTTIYMSREDYDEKGLPEGAMNIRILGD